MMKDFINNVYFKCIDRERKKRLFNFIGGGILEVLFLLFGEGGLGLPGFALFCIRPWGS